MDDNRLARVERLFHEAKRRPPDERAQFLDEASGGDAALRAEVQALLDTPASAAGFMEVPAAAQFGGTVDLTDRRLGVYVVGERIGAGGMGEVYQARDTKLGREVALKVLPAVFAGDPERLARFQREARVLASLNHPNVAQIHGLEEGDGITALVMELVPGPTLADRIAQGSIPIDEAVPIAKQIVDGLEAAHERGIVHRDLKPANVKVRDDGTVKVLDFGLAKAMEPAEGSSPNLSQSPTITTPATLPGTVLGTAAYMAPEQAKGRAVDKRADIWAFGCVLYEMLTGRRVFEGDDVSEVFAGIIKSEPDWARLPAETPPAVGALLRACLQKDVRRRVRDIGDVRLALDGAFETARTGAAETPRPWTSVWRRPAAWFVAGSLVASGFVLGGLMTVREPAESGPLWLSLLAPPGIEFSNVQFAVSPDGTRVVFVGLPSSGGRSLWVTDLSDHGRDATVPLSDTEGAFNPFWSPDSQSVGFFTRGELKRVDLVDGEPVTLVSGLAANLLPGSWNDDGVILFALDGVDGGLFRADATAFDGEAVRVTTVDQTSGEVAHRHPRFLPDGDHFLYVVYGTQNELVVGRLGSPDREPLLSTDYSVEWTATGHLLTLNGGTLVARPFDLDSRRLAGRPASLGISPRFNAGLQKGGYSVSQNGVLVFREGTATGSADSPLMLVDSDGSPEPFTQTVESISTARASPDGSRVVVRRAGPDLNALSVFFISGRPDLPLAVDGTDPVWLDDDRIAFSDRETGEVMVVPADGSVLEPQPLLGTPVPGVPMSVSRDGRLLIGRQGEGTGADLWLVALDGATEPQPWLDTPYEESFGRFSPDGRSIAYMSDRGGQVDVWIGPYGRPGMAGPAIPGGRFPVWSSTGDALYAYVGLRYFRVAVEPDGTAGSEVVPVPWLDEMILFDARRGGQFIASMSGRASQEEGLLDLRVVTNWFEELKRLSPRD